MKNEKAKGNGDNGWWTRRTEPELGAGPTVARDGTFLQNEPNLAEFKNQFKLLMDRCLHIKNS